VPSEQIGPPLIGVLLPINSVIRPNEQNIAYLPDLHPLGPTKKNQSLLQMHGMYTHPSSPLQITTAHHLCLARSCAPS
jgi:hypothetical protein